jgi:hypothetical protein
MNEEMVQEGLIPMNFNFNQAKQSIQGNNYTGLGFDDPNSPNFNPNINMNDPEVRARIMAQRKRDAESAKQQRIANFTQYARNILYECSNAVNNLVRGNRRVGFKKTDADLLAISITNKITEILNSKKLQIDNKIMLENCNAFKQSLGVEYETNVTRYKLENKESIGYNSETGTVIVNPNWLFEMVGNWVNANIAHQQEGDQMIWS